MEVTTKFSKYELIFVFVNSVIAKMFLIFPSQLYELAGTASVLEGVYISLIGLIVCVVFVKLYEKRNFSVNKVTSVFFIIMFVTTTGLLMRCWEESIKITVMPTSPAVYIYLFFLVGMYIVAHIGIKAIVRLHSILLPIIFVAVALLFGGNIINFDLTGIYPLLGNGSKIFTLGLFLIVYISDMSVLLFLMPYSENKKDFSKICYSGWLISSVIMILIISMYVFVINRNISGELNLPVYRLARFLRFGENASHFESLFSIPWFLSFLLHGSLYLYISAKLCSDVVGKGSSRSYLIYFLILIMIIAAIPKTTEDLIKFINYNSIYKIIAGIFLPWGIMLFKRKRIQ